MITRQVATSSGLASLQIKGVEPSGSPDAFKVFIQDVGLRP